jgi:hypothetical protein
MTAETLTMTFDETVDGDSLVPTSIWFRNQAGVGTTNFPLKAFKLTGGDVDDHPPYSTVVVLNLLTVDLNKIKANTALATEASDTFIKLGAGAIADMTNLQTVVGPTISDVISVRFFFFDRTLPRGMPLVPTPARLKLLQQPPWRNPNPNPNPNHQFRPNTEGRRHQLRC